MKATFADNACEEINNLYTSEYSALRNEQQMRYDYSNKLNTGFITFTTAILTIGFGLSAIVGSFLNSAAGLSEELQKGASGLFEQYVQKFIVSSTAAIALEFLQAAFFALPILYSKICFNHSLENSVRISLISSYLEHRNGRIVNWDSVRHNNGIRYFFGSFGTSVPDARVGDLSNMHRIVSWLSLILGALYGFTVFAFCIYELNQKDKRFFFLFIFMVGAVFLSASIHIILIQILRKKYARYEDAEDKILNGNKKKANKDMEYKKILNDLNKDCATIKRWNVWLCWISIAIELIATVIVLVAIPSQTDILGIASQGTAKIDQILIIYDIAKAAASFFFVAFFTFCIWQFPGYKIECNLADNKIKNNDRMVCSVFGQS